MALNHLPHLYHGLRQIGNHLGIELKDPPPVQFLELNGSELINLELVDGQDERLTSREADEAPVAVAAE